MVTIRENRSLAEASREEHEPVLVIRVEPEYVFILGITIKVTRCEGNQICSPPTGHMIRHVQRADGTIAPDSVPERRAMIIGAFVASVVLLLKPNTDQTELWLVCQYFGDFYLLRTTLGFSVIAPTRCALSPQERGNQIAAFMLG